METVRFEEMGLSEEIQKAVRYMDLRRLRRFRQRQFRRISGIDMIGAGTDRNR